MIFILPSFNLNFLYNSTQTSKYFLFSSVVLFIMILFLFYFVLQRYIYFNISFIDFSLFLLIFYITINRYFIQELFSFSLLFYELIFLFLFYIIIRYIPKEYSFYFIIAAICSGSVQAVFGIFQLSGVFSSFNSNFRITGTFFNPGPYAGFLTLIFSISSGIYLFRNELEREIPIIEKLKNSRINKLILHYVPLFCIITILLILPSTRSRAALLSISIISMIYIWIKYDIYLHFMSIFSNFIIRFILIILCILFLGYGLYKSYLYKKPSADGRLLIWNVSSYIIKDYPFFGVGFDRFKAYYMDYQGRFFDDNSSSRFMMYADDVKYSFNDILQFIIEEGFIGFMIFLLLVFSIVKNIKIQCFQFKIYIISLFSIFLFSMFSYPMQILDIKLVVFLLIAQISKLNHYA